MYLGEIKESLGKLEQSRLVVSISIRARIIKNYHSNIA